jgi:hypothetical protein
MRSPHAGAAAGKLLILLALGTASQISPAAAARCPSGEILRVSLGVCVPKAQNLAILSKYAAKPRHGRTQAETAAPNPMDSETTTDDRADEPPPPVEMAQRDAPPPAQKPAPKPAETSSSPFGSLFVGAFRSAVTTGLSAFK